MLLDCFGSNTESIQYYSSILQQLRAVSVSDMDYVLQEIDATIYKLRKKINVDDADNIHASGCDDSVNFIKNPLNTVKN